MDSAHKDANIYGKRVWSLLHSMSAYYPENPNDEDKTNVSDFLESFMDFGIDYDDWGKKFLTRMKENGENPLDTSNRQAFSEWMCRQHNMFNKDLGK